MADRKRILVVEDEEIILADLTRLLMKHGYEIACTAASGVAAVDAAEKCHPDLVLMDVRLQGTMDGVEAARQIRQTSAVPILFITAHAGALSVDRTKGLNGFRSLSKPFSPSQLRAIMQAMLQC